MVNSALLAVGCLGGVLLVLGVGVLLMLFSIDELRVALLRRLDRK